MDYLETVKGKKAEKQEEHDKHAHLEAFTGLAQEIRALLESLEKTGAKTLDKDFIASVKSLTDVSKKIEKIKVTSDEDIKNGLRALAVAFSRLDTRPIVNLPAPKVEVKEREIDFKPLIKEINRPVSLSTGILADYFAQDIDTTDPNTQYIGFVNPKGNWYILENNELANTLRFKFGETGYTEAMKKPALLSYKLLNEAYREVSA